MRVDMAATLEIALKVHPDTRRVFVVAGHSPFDLGWVAEARRTFKPYENRLEFEYITDLPMEDLLARVGELPERSVVYYLHLFQDGTGKTFVPADALDILSRKSNAPVYGHSESYVGRGIVGAASSAWATRGSRRAASAYESWPARNLQQSRFLKLARTRTCSTGANSGVGGSARMVCRRSAWFSTGSPVFGTSTNGR